MNEAVITPDEVATLNEARTALKRIEQRNYGSCVQGTSSIAAHVLFCVLNQANAYLDADLTENELHNGELSHVVEEVPA